MAGNLVFYHLLSEDGQSKAQKIKSNKNKNKSSLHRTRGGLVTALGTDSSAAGPGDFCC